MVVHTANNVSIIQSINIFQSLAHALRATNTVRSRQFRQIESLISIFFMCTTLKSFKLIISGFFRLLAHKTISNFLRCQQASAQRLQNWQPQSNENEKIYELEYNEGFET
jgi:hypothetical protein